MLEGTEDAKRVAMGENYGNPPGTQIDLNVANYQYLANEGANMSTETPQQRYARF